MHLALAILLGLIIGLSLGALGGGGSILTVPALVYVLDEPAAAATTDSLIIVGIASLIAAVGHARSGNVKWVGGSVFGLLGVAASYGGTLLSHTIDANVLLLAFAGLIVVAATAMLTRQRTPAETRATPRTALVASADSPNTPADDQFPEHLTTTQGQIQRSGPGRNISSAAKIVAAGLVVGFLTGFFGVGGGFVIVPALVIVLGYEMPIAVGTSLLVITINTIPALLTRAGSETFHWSIIIPFALAAIAGSLGGKQLATKVSNAALTKAFIVLLFAVAAYVAIRSGVELFS